MRVNEFLPELPSLELDEGLPNIKDKAMAAVTAGSLALGGNLAMNNATAQDIQGSNVPMEYVYGDDNQDSNSASKEAQQFLALTMWGEARSHGEAGMRAVGHVIMNRLQTNKRDFGNDVREVVRDRKQFSCWNSNDPNKKIMMNIGNLKPDSQDRRMWEIAQEVASEILTGQSKDPTHDSLFYHTSNIKPYWTKGVAPVAHIASHVFYQDDAKAPTVKA